MPKIKTGVNNLIVHPGIASTESPQRSMLVNVRLLLVTGMGMFMGAVITCLMRMVVGRGSRGMAVLMLVLVGMGMLVLVGMGMAVGQPLVGV
ncbi:MAG TPA: hypothetical protein VMJ66_11300 [Geobacteraceae bacterium]|nr:hypothetical protein [Geobacteraceae bacterium]